MSTPTKGVSQMNDTEKLLYTLETMRVQRDALLAAAKVVAPYLVAIEHPSAQELLRAIAACEKA